MIITKLTGLLPKKSKVAVALYLLEQISKYTDNTIDDRLVAGFRLALDNKDYGLQRKPTGPRKKVASSKKA